MSINYTTQTFQNSTNHNISKCLKSDAINSKAFRILDYEKYSILLKSEGIMSENEHIKKYCFECEPGRIKNALEKSVKIKNNGGVGNHILNKFKSIKNLYIAPEEFLENNYNKVPILWGEWRGNNSIIQMMNYFKKEYFYLDHSYFARGHERGNYRICLSSRFAQSPKDVCFDRANFFRSQERDKPYMKPWRKKGDHIVVCPPSPNLQVLKNKRSWESSIISKLKKYTDRPIIVKKKDDTNFNCFDNAWCAITDQSNVAYDSLNLGVPIITLENELYSFAGTVGLENVENPIFGDREYLFNWLAYNQFTVKEMESGEAVEILSDIYG